MENQNAKEEVDLFESHQLLCNELVFEKILSYLSHSDQANVRLVCSDWKVLSETKWRSTSTLQIDGLMVNRDPWRVPRSQRLTMNQIVEQVLHANYNMSTDPLDLSKYPYQKLKINGDDQLGIGIMDDVETAFWSYFGPSLKSLHLNKVSLPRGGATQLHRILSEFTPNLKEFEYTQVNIPFRHEPVLVDQIRGIQPNLTSIKINLVVYDSLCLYREMMQSNFEKIRAQPGYDEDLLQHLRPRRVTPLFCFRQRDDPFSTYWLPIDMSDRMTNEYVETQLLRLNGGRPRPQPMEPQFDRMFPFDWKLLYETFPNLKKIQHDFGQITTAATTDVFILVFKVILLDQIKWIGQVRNERLNTLNIDSWNGVLFGGDVTARFCELSLPLRSFSGIIKSATESDFHTFVSSHERTLRELTIHSLGYTFTWLPAGLTYLQIYGSWGQSLDFLEHVPNLETLIFNGRLLETSFTEAFGRQGEVRPLERMNEFQCETVVDDDDFNKFVNLMPNLTKLSIEMDNERWMIASLGWGKLEHLKIFQWAWNEHNFLTEQAFIQFADRFEKLKTFVIEDESHNGSPHFSELSIYGVFLRLPELQTVKVKFSPKVSNEAIGELMEKVTYLDI